MGQSRSKRVKKIIGIRACDIASGGPRVFVTTRKRGKVAFQRRTRRRSRLKEYILLPKKKARRSQKDELSSTRALASLHIHFLKPSLSQPSWRDDEIPAMLRWSIDYPHLVVNYQAWEQPGYKPEHEIPLHTYKITQGIHWNLPPTKPPEVAVARFASHIRTQLSREGTHIQIPAYWPVFRSVDWDQRYLFRPALTDSSEQKDEVNYGYLPDIEGEKEYDSDISVEETVEVRAGNVQQVRIRREWELLEVMHPASFNGWRYQTEERALRRNLYRHAGYLDYNQKSQNQDLWPQTNITAFLALVEIVHDDSLLRTTTELCWLSTVGCLIANVVATEAFPSQWRESLEWPAPFVLGHPLPKIDFTCRAKGLALGRRQKFRPLLYAAQQSNRDDLWATQQLAAAFQPMMLIFILYYLDTRMTRDEPMPPWMVLFGAIYDQDGLFHQAYLPSFTPPSPMSSTLGGEWGWGAHAARMSVHSRGVLSGRPSTRGHILAELYRIQGHCTHVLERLGAWDGYDRACKLLSLP